MKLSDEMLRTIEVCLDTPNLDIATQRAAKEFKDRIVGEEYLDGSGYVSPGDWELRFEAIVIAFQWSGEVSYKYTFVPRSSR